MAQSKRIKGVSCMVGSASWIINSPYAPSLEFASFLQGLTGYTSYFFSLFILCIPVIQGIF